MSEPPQRDLFGGRGDRDRGIDQTAQANAEFMALGLVRLSHLPSGSEFTGEDLRVMLTDAGITPGHPNTWGALVNAAVRRGYLEDTGRVVQMRDRSSHARRTPVWRTPMTWLWMWRKM